MLLCCCWCFCIKLWRYLQSCIFVCFGGIPHDICPVSVLHPHWVLRCSCTQSAHLRYFDDISRNPDHEHAWEPKVLLQHGTTTARLVRWWCTTVSSSWGRSVSLHNYKMYKKMKTKTKNQQLRWLPSWTTPFILPVSHCELLLLWYLNIVSWNELTCQQQHNEITFLWRKFCRKI